MAVFTDRVERRANTRDTEEYLSRGAEAVSEVERLPAETHLRERVMLGLRTAAGVDCGVIAQQLGIGVPEDVASALGRAVERGWLAREGDRFEPTEEGLLFADSMAVEVI
mgnify:CR=1 FL=1